MRWINGGYARYFNKRYNRRGYVFQDRYKSLATQEMAYLCELIRYVHLNPVRAGIVDSVDKLRTYRWSGHRMMIGEECFEWYDTDSTLKRFGNNRNSARSAYLRFLEEGIGASVSGWHFGDERGDDTGVPGDDRLAGDREFIVEALSKVPRTRGFFEQVRATRPSLENILAAVCAGHQVQPGLVFTRGRGGLKKRVRCEFCTKVHREYAYTAGEIADFLNVHSSNVVRAIG